jgi:hypothetical protein
MSFAKEVLDRADAFNGTKSLTTRTTVDVDEPDANLATAHLAAATAHSEANETGQCTSFMSSEGKRRKVDNTLVFELYCVESLHLLDQRWDTIIEPEAKRKYVYFLRMENTRYVKIGFSADVMARLRHLQIGNAIPLPPLCLISEAWNKKFCISPSPLPISFGHNKVLESAS